MANRKLDLVNPGADYRPVPFWSWNDLLEESELRQQIRDMHEAGIGGFFMHARGGLKTVYLSEDWMNAVRCSIDEAAKLGMNAYLYDENGWPSGFGGGLVNGLGEAYQQKYLRFEEKDAAEFAAAGDLAHTISYYRSSDFHLLGRTLPEKASGRIIRAYYEVNPYYVDNLDEKVVAEFIRVTHQHYYDTLPEELRSRMKGIFTDEPQLSRNGIPWSLVLEKEYRKEYKKNLLAELPFLHYDDPECSSVRVRFWRLVAILFRDHFQKQIYDWCDAHGWALTGHDVLEETLPLQIISNGSVMAQYEYYHIPGMDHLSRQNPHAGAMMQLVSVAEQTGKKQILSESFALCGWNFSLAGMRYLFQQQLAHGINLCCPHLQSYTLRGLRKRDYPASLFHHQPWWEHYRVLADYFARIGMLLAEGTPAKNKVLVIHPLSSVWKIVNGNPPSQRYWEYNVRELTTALDALQIEHHYADEIIFEKYGSCENGRIHIGKCSYDTVIIPPLTNLSSKIAKALLEMDAAGAMVLRVRNDIDPDEFTIDGEPASAGMREWFFSLNSCDSALTAAQAAYLAKDVPLQITENGIETTQILSCRRDFASLNGRRGTFYFIVNGAPLLPGKPLCHDPALSCDAEISIAADGSCVEMITAETGEFMELDNVEREDGRLYFKYKFAPGDSLMLFVSKKPAPGSMKVHINDPADFPAVKRIDPEFKVADDLMNLLTLDRCRYRIDDSEWQASDVIDVQTAVLKKERDCVVELEFSFECSRKLDLQDDMYLILENPERFALSLNGERFASEDRGMAFDAAFRKVLLPKNLKAGKNILTMLTDYHQSPETFECLRKARIFETEGNKLTFDSEIENVYLMGRFAVKNLGRKENLMRDAVRLSGPFLLDAMPKTVDVGDLVGSGLPFYAGKTRFTAHVRLSEKEVEKCSYLRFDNHQLCAVRVYVNGRDAGLVLWPPYAVCVADLLKKGDNEIVFEVATSLRNMLGPFHLEEGESYSVNPMSFNRCPNYLERKPMPYNEGYAFVNQMIKTIELV